MINLSGLEVRESVVEKLKKQVSGFVSVPKLVIIQIGNDERSTVYINQKKKFGERIGLPVIVHNFDTSVSEDELLVSIDQYNGDKTVGGVIVQMPIPQNLNRRKILDAIHFEKDVDGLGSRQSGLFYCREKSAIMPATARGVLMLFDYYKIPLEGKDVCIVGRSGLVGRPLMQACLSRNATVTICHSKTRSLKEKTKNADILIVAIGKAGFINSDYVSKGQVVIDVGINSSGPPDKKLRGDVDADSVKGIVSALSPVPGGVGPLTVTALFQNVVEAWRQNDMV
jgi:methylenetetrahydrofolate dehydrogenase (NADP+) / methenyltetrahydrofolate cyclohydrolase